LLIPLRQSQVFGKASSGPASALPQHGFARTSRWELLGKTDHESGGIQLDFGLASESLTEELRQQWGDGKYKFGLIYSVTLSKGSLETSMLVRNEGVVPFDFNLLFHSYFNVDVSFRNIRQSRTAIFQPGDKRRG
jgi:glucose-6-phosphate 1-epimerase